MFVTREPSPKLAPFVELLWLAKGATTTAALEWVLPTGKAQLLINLASVKLTFSRPGQPSSSRSRAAISGPRHSPMVVDTSEQAFVCGASFRAGGLAGLIDVPAGELVGDLVGLDDLWARDDCVPALELLLAADEPSLVLARLEAVLLSQVRRAVPTRAMECASRLAASARSFAAVAQSLGMTQRRLSREFSDAVGLRPKLFQRLARFRRTLRAMEQHECLAEVAHLCGYSDQAHFNHDFREFAEMTPSSYRANRTGYVGHVRAPG